jgi:hypothetical protein
MKKMVFCIIPLMMVLMGYVAVDSAAQTGSPAKPVGTNNNSPGMDLDAAIREVAAQMEAKIPSKTMVALVSVASPSTAFSTQVLTRLESAIVSSGKLVVVDRANLDKIREEQGFQLSGEVDDESAKSIGKLLGAGAIVTGSLADLGDVYSLTLKAINIETATVVVSYLADLAKTRRIETLLASGGGAGSGRPAPGRTTAQTDPVTQIGISTWDLRGRDSVEWFAVLVIDKVILNAFGNTFEGYFDWYSSGAPAGREIFNGMYTSSTRKVNIQGIRLENARGIGMGRYEALLSEDGNHLTRGTWNGGTWEAIKRTQQ